MRSGGTYFAAGTFFFFNLQTQDKIIYVPQEMKKQIRKEGGTWVRPWRTDKFLTTENEERGVWSTNWMINEAELLSNKQ